MIADLDYKRIVLGIILIIVSVSLLVGLVWLVFFRVSDGDEVEPGDGGDVVIPGGALPGTGTGGGGNIVGPDGRLIGEDGLPIDDGDDGQGQGPGGSSDFIKNVELLVEEAVGGVEFNENGFNYLSGEDDRFYFVSLDGKIKRLLSDEEFRFVESVTWAPDGSKAVLEYPDGANIIYDFAGNKKTTLPTGGEEFTFSEDANSVAYKFIGNNIEDNWVVISDTKTNQAQAVQAMGDKADNIQVGWSPNEAVVALYRESTGLDSEEIIFIGLYDENYRSLHVRGTDFKGAWSPEGDRILYHTVLAANDYNPMLWLAETTIDAGGGPTFSLGLSTWVDKCVFSSNGFEAYCAVPVDLETGTGLYPELVNDNPDVFYKINLDNGVSQLIAYPALSDSIEEFQVKKIYITDDNKRLYFWDSFSERVYYMEI